MPGVPLAVVFRYRKQTCRQCDRSGCDKGAGALGWMGKGAGRALSRLVAR